ncbi:Ubiquinone biosynthesis O-methyltransferase [subsurface metagenome]
MLKRRGHKQEVIAGIDEARKYAEENKRYARLMYRALMKDMKALNKPGHYLEMGAGPGILAIMIAEANPDISITAVDLSPDMAAVANEYIRERKLEDRIRYLVGDVSDENMMQGLGKFDLVYSAFSLHHWRDPDKSISNLWNAVRDNGVLYIYDFKRGWWSRLLPVIDFLSAAYTPEEIRAILQKLGINNHKIKTLFPSFLQSITVRK